VSVERRAEIWRAESVEEIKIANLTYQKKFKNRMEYAWNIPKYTKNSKKMDLFLWNVKAMNLKWSH
jgi:hypothetical protein